MKRRDFLQRSGFTLAALGAGDLVSPIVQRYQQALAAPTQRKLALLVGINQYRSAPLYGCVTDVELQRELLIHRFGFQPSDILTLTDQQATREAIATAFVEHLIEQARSGDVVVFHFSGYGGRVALGATPDSVQNGLVTVDEPLMQGDVSVVDDVLADTLLLLLRSLPTDRVTTILDTSFIHSEQPLQGNLRLRSRPGLINAQPSDAALAFQESLLSQTNVDRVRLAAQRRSGQMPGVVLTAAKTDQWATEAKWHGFSAGLFTYALTQQLWQATPAMALRVSLRRATEQIEPLAQTQQPQLSGQKSQERPLMPYHVTPLPLWGADGVVTRLEDGGTTAQLWLGGLAAAVLEQYETNSWLRLVDEPASDPDRPSMPPAQLQILSRDGLFAQAKLHPASTEVATALQVGQFVREQVRVLPRNVGLTIALDRSLARIERVDAISAIAAVPRVSTAIAGEQTADYLFSKTQDVQPTQIAALPTAALPNRLTNTTSQGSYALFSPGRSAIPPTLGEGGEAVKVAVKRLVPKLQALLAAKLLNLTVNDGSSQLAVRATLAVLSPQERHLLLRETPTIAQRVPSLKTLPSLLSPEAKLVDLPVGTHIQYRLENQSDVALHCLLLHIDSNGDLIALRSPLLRPVPSTPEALVDGQSVSDRTTTIAPHETLTLPQASVSFQWLVAGATGLATTYLLCSRAPFHQTMTLLGTRSSDAPSLQTLSKPLEVAQAVLQDLHQASDRDAQPSGSLADSIVLSMNAWASLRFVYHVV